MPGGSTTEMLAVSVQVAPDGQHGHHFHGVFTCGQVEEVATDVRRDAIRV